MGGGGRWEVRESCLQILVMAGPWAGWAEWGAGGQSVVGLGLGHLSPQQAGEQRITQHSSQR